MKVLHVEDNDGNADMVDRWTTKSGVAVKLTRASSVEEARKVIDAGGVGALITDGDLPDGDFRIVADIARRAGIKSIALLTSRELTPELSEEMKQHGVATHIEKRRLDPGKVKSLLEGFLKG